MQLSLPAVALAPNFAWTCPGCNHLNHADAGALNLTIEEVKQLREERGVQPWEPGEFFVLPETVECAECERDYRVAREV